MIMESTGRVIVFIQDDLGVGGIETYFYQNLVLLKEKHIQTVWVCGKTGYVADVFKSVFADGSIPIWKERIDANKLKEMTLGRPDASITIVSSYINGFAMAELFKQSCNWCPVYTFFFVNHFTGWMNYLESAYPRIVRPSMNRRLSKIFGKMNENDNIRYFSDRHISVMEKTYHYKIKKERNNLIVPPSVIQPEFNRERFEKLFERKQFNILTVSRFDFPHKGFVIGLIRTFGELKNEYPNLTLTIVGYGNGYAEVTKAISELPESAKNDVFLHGECSPEELDSFYYNANLNISAAGCFSGGTRLGILSLPVRNYCMECETYGFPPETIKMLVSTEPGKPVKDYIVQALKMTKEEYVQKCRDGYDAFFQLQSIGGGIEDIVNSSEKTLSRRECNYILRVFRVVMVKTRNYSRRKAIKNNGFLNTIKKHFIRKAKHG